MNKKLVSLLLCALITASAAVSCGETAADNQSSPASNQSADTAVDNSGETEPAESETPSQISKLSGNSLDGVTITTLVRQELANEFYAEQTGDIMDTVVYERDRAIEEMFGCKLEYILKPGLWESVSSFQGVITGAVLAGDSTYDIVTGQSNIVQPLNVKGMFVNLLDTKYIDLTQPYWLQSYTEGINLNGKVETVAGDFAISSFSKANVIFFNKAIMDRFGMAYPYEDTLAGTWTLDKYLSMANSVVSDINGDSKYDENDLLGMGSYNNYVQPFFSSTGNQYTKAGADGKRELLAPDDKMIDVAERMFDFIHSDAYYPVEESGETQDMNVKLLFMKDVYLFMGQTVDATETLRDMEVDYGILPYPKYNEQQDRYYDTILRRYTVAAVPITAKSADNSSLILEALAILGSEDVTPKYYEIALKGKYIRDESSSQVLDLIRSSLWLDFVDLYYSDLGFSDYFASYILGSKGGTFASSYEKNRTQWEKKIAKLYEDAE